ncbi:copper chaperone PCu(A)C [Loktanella sp. DJP18]|uniref:copper chaperone PCu(A)C n=1 Tax=Loktanella sp. DJP18 TaxID=3409788 RepID=UPI003BB52D49
MTSLTRLMTALSVALLPGFAMGHDYTLGDLHVAHPHAAATVASAMAGAGYLTILNSGATDDVLIGVEAAFPRVMMHDSTVVDGIARMEALDRVIVPAGETVTFAPGGMHVMFMGLDGDPLDAGEEVPATLIFENAGKLEVVFKVEDVTGTMDHGAMTHEMPASE